MAACARFCRGKAGVQAGLLAAARQGAAPLLRLAELAGRAHRTTGRHPADADLVRALQRIVLLLVAWEETEPERRAPHGILRRLVAACEETERQVGHGQTGPLVSIPEWSSEKEDALPALAAARSTWRNADGARGEVEARKGARTCSKRSAAVGHYGACRSIDKRPIQRRLGATMMHRRCNDGQTCSPT